MQPRISIDVQRHILSFVRTCDWAVLVAAASSALARRRMKRLHLSQECWATLQQCPPLLVAAVKTLICSGEFAFSDLQWTPSISNRVWVHFDDYNRAQEAHRHLHLPSVAWPDRGVRDLVVRSNGALEPAIFHFFRHARLRDGEFNVAFSFFEPGAASFPIHKTGETYWKPLCLCLRRREDPFALPLPWAISNH